MKQIHELDLSTPSHLGKLRELVNEVDEDYAGDDIDVTVTIVQEPKHLEFRPAGDFGGYRNLAEAGVILRVERNI